MKEGTDAPMMVNDKYRRAPMICCRTSEELLRVLFPKTHNQSMQCFLENVRERNHETDAVCATFCEPGTRVRICMASNSQLGVILGH